MFKQEFESRFLQRRDDPAGILPEQNRYMREMNKRTDEFKKRVRKKILSILPEAVDNSAIENTKYDFPKLAAKKNEFRRFIERTANLMFVGKQFPKAGDEKGWAGVYIESAYRKGLVRSYMEVRGEEGRADAEDTFAAPKNAGILRNLYSRNYQRLRGISEDTAEKMRNILTKGVADGLSPYKIANQMSHTADVTKVRARTIARTESSYAHSEGTLTGYEMLGITDVGAMVEFRTVEDDLVCADCASLASGGKRWKVEDAHGIIPVHPNCRCVWIPVLLDDSV